MHKKINQKILDKKEKLVVRLCYPNPNSGRYRSNHSGFFVHFIFW